VDKKFSELGRGRDKRRGMDVRRRGEIGHPLGIYRTKGGSLNLKRYLSITSLPEETANTWGKLRINEPIEGVHPGTKEPGRELVKGVGGGGKGRLRTGFFTGKRRPGKFKT